MNPIRFFVLGVPQTAGSKRSFIIPRKGQPLVKDGRFNGRVLMTDDNPRGRDWKNRVAQEGALAVSDLPFNQPLLEGALQVSFIFYMPRLKSHFRANGQLKDNAPSRPTVRPDALKLGRCAEDALTGVIWRDDSQIVIEHLEKSYSDKPGMLVTIEALEPQWKGKQTQPEPEPCRKDSYAPG